MSAPAQPEIIRDHLIRTLVTLLSGEIQIVVVEGEEGIGKSTILRHFKRHMEDRTCGIFLSTASRWAYDPQQIEHDLLSQMHWLLYQEEMPEAPSQMETDLRRHFNALRKRAARDGQPFYFILDGIEDIPSADEGSRRQILALFPFGMEGFRFLLSGNLLRLGLSASAMRTAKPFQLSPFSREESSTYLDDCGLSVPNLAEVYKITGGTPGHLASIRRLLASRSGSDALIENLPEQLPELFKLEWRAVQPSDNLQVIALAIVAHETRTYSLEEIGSIMGISVADLEPRLLGLSFIELDSEQDVRFVSDAYRRFAASELAPYRSRVTELLIDFFLRNPESDTALINLPSYFTSADRLNELVQYLSPERFARLYQRAPTLKIVQQQADRGIAAARALNRTDDLVRFTLQRSALEEISESTVGLSEVKAIAAVGDYETALALAEAAPRIELRFRLLAAIARVRKDNGSPEDSDLRSRIRALFDQLEPGALGKQLEAAASDVFAIWPELAIELVSKSAGVEGENAIDWAFASLAVQAHLDDVGTGASQHAQNIRERIQDPAAKRLSLHAMVSLSNMNSGGVLDEIKRVDSTGDKLYILRHWMLSNSRDPGAIDVLDAGLNIAMHATGYTANARVYRQLCYCLLHLKARHQSTYYLSLIDGQRNVLRELGPLSEFYRLQLLLARAEWNHDQIAASDRLISIYNDVTAVKDPVVRTSAMARLAATISRLRADQVNGIDIREVVDQELQDGVALLLGQAAEHFEVCREIIQALAVARPTTALDLIGQMNTEWRRDLGYREFVESAFDGGPEDIPTREIQSALDQIVSPYVRNSALEAMFWNIRVYEISDAHLPIFKPLLFRIGAIDDPSLRGRVCSKLIKCLADNGIQAEEVRRMLITAMKSSWEECEGSARKLDLGYEIVSDLAACNLDLAHNYVSEVNALKTSLTLFDDETTSAAVFGVLLANRALSGLVKADMRSKDDVDRLLLVIEQCGSVREQATLLADLAVRCYLAEGEKLCQQIVQDRLVPLVFTVTAQSATRAEILVDIAPALYVGASATSMSLLSELDDTRKNEAIRRTILVLLRRVAPTDPFATRAGRGFDIRYEEVNRILGLMRLLTTDSTLYAFVEALIDSVASYHANFNRAQRAEVVRQLELLITQQFPNPRFIRHFGYQLAARAQLNRIRVGNPTPYPPAALAQSAREIPNAADRAYVLAIIGSTISQQKERRTYLTEAKEIIDGIPMLTDRLGRYEVMCSLVAEIDSALCKEFLREALAQSLNGRGETIEEQRNSLLDAAYRLDPSFANSLVSVTDDDPAKKKIEQRLALHKLSDSLAPRQSDADLASGTTGQEFARAAWIRLGSLNASRVSAVSPERGLPTLQYAAPQPVSSAYPIFAWFIENAVRRRENPREIRQYVLPMFEACLRGAELAILTAPRVSYVRNPILSMDLANSDSGNTLVVDSGDRDLAIDALRQWLSEGPIDKLYITEPYFDPQSVELLSLVKDAADDCEVIVLCSRRESLKDVEGSAEEAYREAWYRIRQDEPPLTTVILGGTRSGGKFPIHDRWWLSTSGGVDLGTSYNGLGSRISKVRTLSATEVSDAFEHLRPYFQQSRLEFEGERMTYTSFML